MRISARIAVPLAVLGVLATASPAQAVVVPRHAVNICQTASFYDNYDSASGPYGLKRVLEYGNKVGHTPARTPSTTAGRRPSTSAPTTGATCASSASEATTHGEHADAHRRRRPDRARAAGHGRPGAGRERHDRGPGDRLRGVAVRADRAARRLDGHPLRGTDVPGQGPRSGGYVYGFAYGHVNRNGWVQDGWFC
ncbi:hypothetical protein ACFQY4_05660 [Catellatospora bangladeshensis]|uniref:hypothetical protein n=1 Tax=Catellatospora bangladeshensis TaxID=310355 RepID=UPI00362314B2